MYKLDDFLDLLEKLVLLFDDLTEVEQTKLEAVTKKDIDTLNDCMKEEQAYLLQFRGLDKKREERLAFIEKIEEQLKKQLKIQHIEAEIKGRAKHLYSIYKKMKRDNCTLEQIYDLFALRIIVNSVKDCYAALGVVHELYNPMPGRFKDYIAVPKPNMYQ